MKNAFISTIYFLTLSAFAVALVFAGNARNAYSAESNILVVDIKKIMKDSKAASSVRNQVKAKQKSFQAELDSKEKALQNEDKALATQRSTLSKEEFEKKYRAFRDKAVAAQKSVQEKRRKLDQSFAKALGKIQDKVQAIVGSIASAKGADAAIAKSQLIYAKAGLDITAQVLSQLDSEMPSVAMSF